MATDFDQWPVYDQLVKNDGKISDVWGNSLSAFIQNLTSYLGSFGLFMPNLTTMQRDSIISPRNGQMIYNTTLNTAQYFKNGTWSSF